MFFFFIGYGDHRDLHVLTPSFPTRRSSDLVEVQPRRIDCVGIAAGERRQRRARIEVPGVEEVRTHAPGLERELPEAQCFGVEGDMEEARAVVGGHMAGGLGGGDMMPAKGLPLPERSKHRTNLLDAQPGRTSCREKVWISVW